jgi:hypothetical protein
MVSELTLHELSAINCTACKRSALAMTYLVAVDDDDDDNDDDDDDVSSFLFFFLFFF